MKSTNLLNNIITYEVTKTNENNISISIKNDRVYLIVPSYFSENDIEKILIDKKDWIYSKLNIEKNIFTDLLPIFKGTKPYTPEYTFIYGNKYIINLVYGQLQEPKLNLNPGYIDIILPLRFRHLDNSNLLKVILFKMYTKIAENDLDSILEKARITLKLSPEDIEIKRIKSDNTIMTEINNNNKITINPLIMIYNKEVIEYIIFHTFCHLKYKTHSKFFYNILNKHFDNIDELEAITKNIKY